MDLKIYLPSSHCPYEVIPSLQHYFATALLAASCTQLLTVLRLLLSPPLLWELVLALLPRDTLSG